VSKSSSSETQERLHREKAEQQAKTAKQKADRLAAEAKKTDELDQHAKRVAALYKSMREFEAHAEEKAGFELKKAAEKRAALEQALVEARELCKATGENFKAFQEKYAPEYKRTRLYQVLAIADGRMTPEDIRKEERERKRRQRAAGKLSGTNDVPDKTAEPEVEEAKAGKNVSIKPTLKALRKRAENIGVGYWVHHRRNDGKFRLTSKDDLSVINCGDSLDEVARQLDKIESAQPAPVEQSKPAAPSHEPTSGTIDFQNGDPEILAVTIVAYTDNNEKVRRLIAALLKEIGDVKLNGGDVLKAINNITLIDALKHAPAEFIGRVGAEAAEAFCRAVLVELLGAAGAADAVLATVETVAGATSDEPVGKAIKPGEPLVWDDANPDKNDQGKRRGRTEPLPDRLHYLIQPQWKGEKVIGYTVDRFTFKPNGSLKATKVIASGDLTYDECKIKAQTDFNITGGE
jgi:hypothetical protein